MELGVLVFPGSAILTASADGATRSAQQATRATRRLIPRSYRRSKPIALAAGRIGYRDGHAGEARMAVKPASQVSAFRRPHRQSRRGLFWSASQASA